MVWTALPSTSAGTKHQAFALSNYGQRYLVGSKCLVGAARTQALHRHRGCHSCGRRPGDSCKVLVDPLLLRVQVPRLWPESLRQRLREAAMPDGGIDVRLASRLGLLPCLKGRDQTLVDVPDGLVRSRFLNDGAAQLKIVAGDKLQNR